MSGRGDAMASGTIRGRGRGGKIGPFDGTPVPEESDDRMNVLRKFARGVEG